MKALLTAILILTVLSIVVAPCVLLLPHHNAWQISVAAIAALPAIEGGGAFTIREFCQAHRISAAFYYVMKNEGWGPREMTAGSRILISFEAAAAWRREREAAASAGHHRAQETETAT